MHRIIPADSDSPGHPNGLRVGVPLDLVQSEAVERKESEEDLRYGSSSAVIPGVRFEDGHPLDLRTPADLGVVRHAVRAGWNIKPHMKACVVETMMTILQDADMARDKINAAKVLIAADRIDSREQVASKLDVTVDVKGLTDEQLMARLAEIEAMETIAPPPPALS